ncbi:MAG: hypothetical protein CMJ18_06200 [Phycisphaeraceae bacterium]|nr:hypothetical protein [Phycisphaeraceae bacterium]
MSGNDQIETIVRDVTCVACEYNLRGLQGPVVKCPECGAVTDVAALVASRWGGPWYRAPGFDRLARPLAVAVVGWLLTVFMAGVANATRAGFELLVLAVVPAGALVAWVALIVATGRRSGVEGVMLALLAHLIYSGYVFGFIGFLMTFAGAFMPDMSWLVVACGFCVAVMIACYHGERFIGRRCIARYLAFRPF